MISQINKAYGALSSFRANRDRLKRFTFGSQWDDMMTTPDGLSTTEGKFAAERGRVPLTNNMIHRLVKTLVGHFRSSLEPDDDADINRLNELDARMMEEFLISGCAVQRIVRERRPGTDGEQTWVDNVSPDEFFCYPLRDPRASDIEIIGMFHTWTIDRAIARFASGSKSKADELRRILRAKSSEPEGFQHCRLIEVWHHETVETLRCHDLQSASFYSVPICREPEIAAMNRRRIRRGQPRIVTRYELTSAWVGRFLTDDGLELCRLEAENHPFSVKFYPLIDGEIHSFVSSLIDQQKYVNRLITMIDNMMATSAKGVLLFPQDELPEGMTWEDVTDRWASYDGVIPYLPRPGSQGPKQVITNPTNCGAYDLLNLEMKLFDQISGVSGALSGKADGGNSAQLFDAQTRNSLVAISDIFASFNDFRHQTRLKLNKNHSTLT